jgi:hypothetical protein
MTIRLFFFNKGMIYLCLIYVLFYRSKGFVFAISKSRAVPRIKKMNDFYIQGTKIFTLQ